jgi:hypothetical protein
MGKRLVVKKVPIPVVEMIIGVISHFNHPLFSPESVAIIVPYLMVKDFDGPVAQVFPIKKGNPFFLLRSYH